MSATAGAARVSSRAPRPPARQANVSRVPYLPGLDGMRAFAVVAVMVYHANSDWLKGGFFGVEVFFVISGYLITLLLIAEKERTDRVDMKQFWIRRARRLLPALFAMLLMLTVWTALFKSEEVGKLRGDVLGGLFYVSNWYQIWVGAGYAATNDFAPLRHLWSLAVEEQFYLLWPLVMVVLLRNGSRRVAELSRWLFLAAVVVTVAVALLYHPGQIGTPETTPEAYWHLGDRPISKADTLYLGTFSRSAGLLLGAAFAMLWRPVAVMRGPLRTKGPLLDVAAVVGFAVLVVMSVQIGFIDAAGADAWLFRGGFFFASIATLGVIAAVTHERTLMSRVMSAPPLVWIGLRSYGLYLFSWPIFQMIRGIAGKKLTVGEFVVAMIISVVVTELSYRFIETPVRKGALGRIGARLRDRRDPGRRNAVLGGAFVGTALTIFAVGSLATADLQQNEVEQSLAEGRQVACGFDDPDCSTDTDSTVAAAPAASTDSDGADAADAADATAATVATVATTTVPLPPIERLAIGDSVMLGAAGRLAELGFEVRAEESRQFSDGAEFVAQLAAEDRLGQIVVVHLGTNGPIGEDAMQAMLDTLAEVPQVLLVTNDVERDFTTANNAMIYDAVNSRENVFLLDWQGNAPACPGDCFASDEIHLRPDGQAYYAALVAGALGI